MTKKIGPDASRNAPLELDHVHRALGPKNPNLEHPRDVICRVHFYAIKADMMQEEHTQEAIYFNGAQVFLVPDLSKVTLDMCRALKPLIGALQAKQMKYRSGFTFLHLKMGIPRDF